MTRAIEETRTGTDPSADPAATPGRRSCPARASTIALLAGTAALYLWGLSGSGWGNAFYAAAAQAGGRSWSAWFFGASDAAGGITVDKAPGAVWPIGLSVRLFGPSSWSVLVPQALMGVGSVALLRSAVARVAGPGAGLLAGTVLALTPVAVLMFRFDNPDAMLVLVLTAASYAVTRALEDGRARWLAVAGVLVGYGFLAKMLQAFLVLPAFTAVWLLAAPVAWWPRVRGLLAGGVAVVASAGWWVLVVELLPTGSRPWIGGSQTDSVLELVLGYNGLGRLSGDEVGSVGGARGWGDTGLLRLFGPEMGREASWLLPAALLLLAILIHRTRRAPRTDPVRTATLLWGGWLLTTGLTFSLMAGIVHSYYTVALAPAVAALVGIGGVALWRDRERSASRWLLAATIALTAARSFTLLPPDWLPWLRWVLIALGTVVALALVGVHRMPRAATAGVLVAAVPALLGGAAAWSAATAVTPHTGAVPSSGPPGYEPWRLQLAHRGSGGAPDAAGVLALLRAPTPSSRVAALLADRASAYRWAAAAIGSNQAAGYQLATGAPVLAVGGFNGTDPFPTLPAFRQMVVERRVHWFVDSPGADGVAGARSGGSDDARQISRWVAATFPARTVDGVTVHDLTGGTR